MAKSRRDSPASDALEALRRHLKELEGIVPSLSRTAARKTRALLDDIRNDIEKTAARLDPIREPSSLFDPADSEMAGRLVVLALLAQPRVPLDLVARTYGAGVYAIYYRGEHPYYSPISRTETPIYVGKADPKESHARTAREQGDRLYGRLKDHRKIIRLAESYALEKHDRHPLKIIDFECRRLVTVTNAQLVAEKHLINLFRPVWNSDVDVCWGISKHGDREGRSNTRSPWYVVHPIEYWASQTKLKDARTSERIIDDIRRHFATVPIFTDRDRIVDEFLENFVQDPMIEAAPIEDDGDENDEN